MQTTSPKPREITEAQFVEWERRQPRPDDGCWPPERWAEIVAAVRSPEPPRRFWGQPGLFKMETRAWIEWKRARGQLRYADDERRPNLPDRLRRAVIARDGRVCGICGGAVEPDDIHIDHIDHVIPVALGGPTEMSNLQVSHSRCNIKKGATVAAH